MAGIILAAYGLAPFIFGFIGKAIVNPENGDPTISVPGGRIFDPESKQAARPLLMRVYALSWLVMYGLAIASLRRKTSK